MMRNELADMADPETQPQTPLDKALQALEPLTDYFGEEAAESVKPTFPI